MLEVVEGLAPGVSPTLILHIAIYLFVGATFNLVAERQQLRRARHSLLTSLILICLWPPLLAAVIIKLLVKGRPPKKPPQ